VQLSAMTQDYGYDDNSSKPNPITGTFRLPNKSKSELWVPLKGGASIMRCSEPGGSVALALVASRAPGR
jgi:hypothetical protein